MTGAYWLVALANGLRPLAREIDAPCGLRPRAKAGRETTVTNPLKAHSRRKAQSLPGTGAPHTPSATQTPNASAAIHCASGMRRAPPRRTGARSRRGPAASGSRAGTPTALSTACGGPGSRSSMTASGFGLRAITCNAIGEPARPMAAVLGALPPSPWRSSARSSPGLMASRWFWRAGDLWRASMSGWGREHAWQRAHQDGVSTSVT